jgi:antirestriction protein ArdC
MPTPLGRLEGFARATGAVIRWGGTRAYYEPRVDTIWLPPTTWFDRPEHYMSAMLHELTHWTGHHTRLGRNLSFRDGDEAHAFEEVIAELGAAFLGGDLALWPQLPVEHATYLRCWLEQSKLDEGVITRAAPFARRATRYLLALGGGPERAAP